MVLTQGLLHTSGQFFSFYTFLSALSVQDLEGKVWNQSYLVPDDCLLWGPQRLIKKEKMPVRKGNYLKNHVTRRGQGVEGEIP